MTRCINSVFIFVLALFGRVIGIQPKPGSGLSSEELRNITSVECLEARQKDPHAVCDDLVGADGRKQVTVDLKMAAPPAPSTDPLEPSHPFKQELKKIIIKYSANPAVSSAERLNGAVSGELSHYSYPNFHDPECNSDGAIFCDPYQVMTDVERSNLSSELALLRKQHLVVCEDLVLEPLNERHLQPFYLSVALAEAHGPDAEDMSLKQYAKLIMTEWNTDQLYASVSQMTRCPNRAFLLVLPGQNKAALYSESAAYISEQGASDAQKIVESELRRGKTVASAVLAGVRSAYGMLPNTVIEGEAMPALKETEVGTESMGFSWVLFVERALFAFAVMALVMSLIIGMLVMFFAPGLAKGRSHL